MCVTAKLALKVCLVITILTVMACQVNDFTLRYEAYVINYYETLGRPCSLIDEQTSVGVKAANLIADPVTTKPNTLSTSSAAANRLNLIDQNYRHYDHKELMARNGSRLADAEQEVIIKPTEQSWLNFWWTTLGVGHRNKESKQLYLVTSLDKGDYRPAIGCALIAFFQLFYIVAITIDHLPLIIGHSLLWFVYAVSTYFMFRIVGSRAWHDGHYHLSAWSMLLPSPITLILMMVGFILVVVLISLLFDERRGQRQVRRHRSAQPSHHLSGNGCVHRRSVRVPLILPKDMDLDNI